MEANDEKKEGAGTEIAAEQAGEVGGGDATATIGTCGGSISSNGPTAGSALIDIYEGAVELTTHVIERVTAR
jgi:hypothetical protein